MRETASHAQLTIRSKRYQLVTYLANQTKLPILAKLSGSMWVQTYDGYGYSTTITLPRQRYVSIHMLNRQRNIDEFCHELIAWIERQKRVNVKRFHSDISLEFLNLRGLQEDRYNTYSSVCLYPTCQPPHWMNEYRFTRCSPCYGRRSRYELAVLGRGSNTRRKTAWPYCIRRIVREYRIEL